MAFEIKFLNFNRSIPERLFHNPVELESPNGVLVEMWILGFNTKPWGVGNSLRDHPLQNN